MSKLYDFQEDDYDGGKSDLGQDFRQYHEDSHRESSMNYYKLQIKISSISEQIKAIKEDNEKLSKLNFLLKESEAFLIDENKILKEKNKVFEEKLKICEFEKEDACERLNIITENYDEEGEKVKSLKNKLSKKDQEIIILRKENENLKVVNGNLEKYLKNLIDDEENLTIDCNKAKRSISFTSNNLHIHNRTNSSPNNICYDENELSQKEIKNNFQSISTVYSSSNPKGSQKQNELDLHENCLSNLYPELELSDDECEKPTKINIKLTPVEVVRRFSLKEPKTNRLNLADQYFTEKPLKEKTTKLINIDKEKIVSVHKIDDIYKEFFMLTYQAVVINSNDLENLQKSYNDKEILYKKILDNNIPFHKVCIIKLLVCRRNYK
jgi:hypothetical protein